MDQVKQAAEQGYATLVAELAAPYFFEKLSAHGITPRSEDEAAEMWTAAQKLHVLYTAEQQKAAAVQTSKLASANAQLDAALVAAGLAGSEKVAAFNQAAEVAAQHADIADAVLKLQAAAAIALQNAG
jgi:DUF1680 family protein